MARGGGICLGPYYRTPEGRSEEPDRTPDTRARNRTVRRTGGRGTRPHAGYASEEPDRTPDSGAWNRQDGAVRGWRVFGLRVLRVYGPSMVPTLRPGELLLVRSIGVPRWPRAGRPAAAGSPTGRVAPGQIVIARFRSMPATLVVKRVHARSEDGWVLRSDNPYAGGDSRVHGLADVEGVAVLRWRPGLRAPRWIGPAPQ